MCPPLFLVTLGNPEPSDLSPRQWTDEGTMAKAYFTTNDTFKICKVTSQTVMNWVKSGRLKAFSTPGGHRRVMREDLVWFMERKGLDLLLLKRFEERSKGQVPHYWEYFSTGFSRKGSAHDYHGCLVPQSKALRCYLLKYRTIQDSDTCKTSCQICPYLRKYGRKLGSIPWESMYRA